MTDLTDDALEEAVREGFEHYGYADCDAALAELVDRLTTMRPIVEAARTLVGGDFPCEEWGHKRTAPWWGYVYDAVTLECAICEASTPALDDGKDAEHFATMKHKDWCPAVALDAAVKA
jgi:hypothetical protein